MNRSLLVKKRDLLFYLAYILLIGYRVIKSSTIGLNDHGITYIIICLLFLGRLFMLENVKVQKFLACMLSIPVVILSIINIYDPVIPIVFLALLSAIDIDFDSIVKVSYYTVIPLVLGVLLLSWLGLITDNITYRYFGGRAVQCHGMGFNHSSALPTYYCFLFLEDFYINKRKYGNVRPVIWLAGGYLIFIMCAERLRFFMLFIIVFFIACRFFLSGHFDRTKKTIMTLCFPILSVMSILLGSFYNASNPLMYSLNIALSNRLYFENYAFNNFAVSLFGNEIQMGEKALSINGVDSYFYLDSGYIYMLFAYGIIITIIIIACYTYGAIRSYKLNDYSLMLWFFVLAVDSVVGNQLMSIWISPILFLLFAKYNSDSISRNRTTNFNLPDTE